MKHAEQAAHEAVAYIQKQLGVTSGDDASIFFSGSSWDQLVNILARYERYEAQIELDRAMDAFQRIAEHEDDSPELGAAYDRLEAARSRLE